MGGFNFQTHCRSSHRKDFTTFLSIVKMTTCRMDFECISKAKTSNLQNPKRRRVPRTFKITISLYEIATVQIKFCHLNINVTVYLDESNREIVFSLKTLCQYRAAAAEIYFTALIGKWTAGLKRKHRAACTHVMFALRPPPAASEVYA